MFGQTVESVMQTDNLLVGAPHSTVLDAAIQMARRKVGAMLVLDGARLVGIFTERDALIRVLAASRDPARTLLAEVMTPEPTTITPDKSFGLALLVMHEEGFRHLPVVEAGRVVGIVSARNALDPDLEEFAFEASRRQYYLRERD